MKQKNTYGNKGSILLVAALLIISTVAVTANTTTKNLPVFLSQPILSPNTGGDNNPNPRSTVWVHFDNGAPSHAIGVGQAYTWEAAIRITSTEWSGRNHWNVTSVKFYHNAANGARPWNTGNIKIYDQGTQSAPGAVLRTQAYNVTGSGWRWVNLTQPVLINSSRDMWVSVQVVQKDNLEYPMTMDTGPAIPYKGDWAWLGSWVELRLQSSPLNYNWNIWVKTDGTNSTLIANAHGPYTGVVNVPIQFTGSATGGTLPYTWLWSFGDGGTSTQQNPSHSYQSAGVYTVNLTVTDSHSTRAWNLTTATIVSPLVANAHGPYTGFVNVPIAFTGSATGGTLPYSWHWDFGDGGTSTQQNPSHSYQSAGVFTVNLTVTDAQARRAWNITSATIVSMFVVDAHGPYAGVVNVPIAFTGFAAGGTPPYTWLWNFGDGGTSTEQNPTHSYQSAGVYTVNLTVTDSHSNRAWNLTTATIVSPLVADAHGPYTGIVSVPIAFTGSATGGTPPYTWLWDFGDGGTKTQQNPTYSYQSAGVYTVNLTVTDAQSRRVWNLTTATIVSPLAVDAHGPYTGVVNVPLAFTGSATGGTPPYTWHWNFGDGGTSSQQNPTYSYQSAGVYTVNLTVTDAQSRRAWNLTTATIVKPLIADANGPYTGEINTPITFNGSARGGTPAYTWLWNFGDGGTSTQQNPTHTYQSAGIFTVNLTVTDAQARRAWNVTTATITNTVPVLTITAVNIGPIGKISATIQNNGNANATNVNWYISLKGGLILIGSNTTGTITKIISSGSAAIVSGFIFGLSRNTTITIHAKCAEGSEDTVILHMKVILFFLKAT